MMTAWECSEMVAMTDVLRVGHTTALDCAMRVEDNDDSLFLQPDSV